MSSSNFPHYVRNLNTGAYDDDPQASARRASQTILHTCRYPSQLLLPVAKGVTRPR